MWHPSASVRHVNGAMGFSRPAYPVVAHRHRGGGSRAVCVWQRLFFAAIGAGVGVAGILGLAKGGHDAVWPGTIAWSAPMAYPAGVVPHHRL
mmetsp:Transcript_10186/g.27700  ORF Transcript_10186/g.27700 Transcript_10186/m.27700 type:complete len:92 (-) Transcript_10186:468-743(-)